MRNVGKGISLTASAKECAACEQIRRGGRGVGWHYGHLKEHTRTGDKAVCASTSLFGLDHADNGRGAGKNPAARRVVLLDNSEAKEHIYRMNESRSELIAFGVIVVMALAFCLFMQIGTRAADTTFYVISPDTTLYRNSLRCGRYPLAYVEFASYAKSWIWSVGDTECLVRFDAPDTFTYDTSVYRSVTRGEVTSNAIGISLAGYITADFLR